MNIPFLLRLRFVWASHLRGLTIRMIVIMCHFLNETGRAKLVVGVVETTVERDPVRMPVETWTRNRTQVYHHRHHLVRMVVLLSVS